MKTIKIVLTKYSDLLSNFLYVTSGFGYTHASIGFGTDEGEFYSFGYRGFCTDTIEKYKRRGVTKSICYQLQVPDSVYRKLHALIEQFHAHRTEFCYTKMGVFFCMLRIPFKREKHYFCSQFVAEMLEKSGAFQLRKTPSLYLPNHFCRELERSSQVQAIQYNVV